MVAVKPTSPLVIDSNGCCADWGQRFPNRVTCTYNYTHGSVHVHFIADQHLLEMILQVKDEFQQPAKVFLGMVCITTVLCVAYYYECLEFCGLPHLVLLYYTSEHSSIATVHSWTLLRAFGPHGLLMLYVHTYVRTSPLIWFRASR